MKPLHWDLLKSIVDKALILSGSEKDLYLKSIYCENPDISVQVNELLRAIEESEALKFMAPISQGQKELMSDLCDSLKQHSHVKTWIDKIVGPYRITEKLGSGGMGTVYRATRIDGEFHQYVAIKFIKSGVDTEENIQRFRMEREILSALKHPNIAQIYDGGVTEDGLPYLIMEYISGQPIDRFCNKNRLTVGQRLNLFKQVCNAVQFAHSNLVIHRDLKTQNIHITDEGVVKILDFGVAKLLDADKTEFTLIETQPGQKFWTPQYAAPELVKGETVTTATDIYALGVLLHNLLTNMFPHSMKGETLAEIESIIKEKPPQSLIQSFANNPNQQECLKQRKISKAELKKILKGDLDALVLKAIRKEPAYRYASASQLLEEIERYQSGLPLLAQKGTLQYKTGKFIRRHKTGIATAAIFLMFFSGFGGFYTWQISKERDRIQLESEKSEQVAQFLVDLFMANNPVDAQGVDLTGRELLQRGVERIENLSDQPIIQAEMFYTIGRVFRGMNQPEEALPLLEKALKLQNEYLQKDHPDIAHTLNMLGSVYWSDQKAEKAHPYLQKALEMRRRLYGDYHPDVFTSMNNLALVLKDLGKLNKAENMYLETLEARKEYYGNEHAKIGVSLNNLAFLLQERGKYIEAETYYRQTVNMFRKLQGNQHSDVAIGLNNLGAVLHKLGKLDEAEEVLKESIAIRHKVYGEEHMKVGYALNNLALVQKDRNDFVSAGLTAQKSLSIFYKTHGNEHNNIAVTLSILGDIFKAERNYTKAEEYYLKALTMRRNLYGDQHIQAAHSLKNLGTLYLDQRRSEKAEPVIREALTIYTKFYPAGDWRIAHLKMLLGSCLLDQIRYREAEPLFLEVYDTFNSIDGFAEQYVQEATNHLITLYEKWDNPEKAVLYRDELMLAEH